MSFALLSALSILCVDAAAAARPLPQPAPMAPVVTTLAMVQEAPAETLADRVVLSKADTTEDVVVDAAVEPTLGEAEPEDEAFADPLVFESESDEAVAEKLIAYLESVDTLSGEFTQIAPSGAISDGKFYLDRPGKLRFEYEPPTPLLLVASGGLVYVRDEALETTDSYPVGRTPLKFLLSRKIDRDDAQVVSVDRGVDNVAVTFSSSDEETEGELTLIASAPDFALRRWIVRDPQGGMTIVTLNNVKSGERLANSLFAAPEAGGRFLNR